METIQAIVLGVVQGVAEFLPISSSGHLVIIPELLGWQEFAGNIAFDVLLHLGSLVAVVLYFRRDFWHMITAAFSRDEEKASDRRLARLVTLGTTVTGVIGLALNDVFEAIFYNVIWVGVFLLATSAILTLAESLSRKREHAPERMTWVQSILVGLAQGAAIAPGLSRSGTTISAGLAVGLDREQAARFSFLLSAPIILLAGGKTALDAFQTPGAALPGAVPSIAGFLAAALAGYATIAWLIGYLRNKPLYPFAVYTGIVGVLVIIWQMGLI